MSFRLIAPFALLVALACPDPPSATLDEVYERVGSFLERLQRERHRGDVVLVSHGGAIRAMRAYCAGVPMRGTKWDVVSNGSVSPVRQPSISPSSK